VLKSRHWVFNCLSNTIKEIPSEETRTGIDRTKNEGTNRVPKYKLMDDESFKRILTACGLPLLGDVVDALHGEFLRFAPPNGDAPLPLSGCSSSRRNRLQLEGAVRELCVRIRAFDPAFGVLDLQTVVRKINSRYVLKAQANQDRDRAAFTVAIGGMQFPPPPPPISGRHLSQFQPRKAVDVNRNRTNALLRLGNDVLRIVLNCLSWEMRHLVTWKAHDADVQDVSFSPDGLTILSCAQNDWAVKVWHASNGTLKFALEGHLSDVLTCSFAPCGETILTSSFDGSIKLWHAQSGECHRTLNLGSCALSCCFSHDGERILSGNSDGRMQLWDVTGGLLATVMGCDGLDQLDCAYCCAFSKDDRFCAAGFTDSTLKLWGSVTFALLLTFEGDSQPVLSCTFSNDGAAILSASRSGAVNIWSTVTGQSTHTLEGHSDMTFRACYSPRNNKNVLSASNDKALMLWNSVTGQLERIIGDGKVPVTSCAFAPVGKSILGAFSDGTLAVWGPST
jgi:hypothetical protein